MASEKYIQDMYNKFGKEYQRTRDEKRPGRSFNEFLELPSMLNAVGNIKNKKLLDVGCGAGIHAKIYWGKGAKVYGVDISKTMVEMAQKNCPSVEFKIGSISKLPYPNSKFDIVTASLSLHYIKNLDIAFKEINRVLKKDCLFYYSTDSPLFQARETYEDKNFKIKGIGQFLDKRTGKEIYVGLPWKEYVAKWEMVPGMIIKSYRRTFRTQLNALVCAGFELVDIIDLKPTPQFKKHNPFDYKRYTKLPAFSIYVAKKK